MFLFINIKVSKYLKWKQKLIITTATTNICIYYRSLEREDFCVNRVFEVPSPPPPPILYRVILTERLFAHKHQGQFECQLLCNLHQGNGRGVCAYVWMGIQNLCIIPKLDGSLNIGQVVEVP